jgi:lysophospholipase L1-like esterase
VFSDAANLIAPTISRVCFYPFQGAVYMDNVSFTIDRRKPARFIVVGDSISEGYNATAYSDCFISVLQSNFTQAVCNDSGSYNTTSNSVSLLPEILAHQPGTAVLMIGGNDIQFGYPASQWQTQYSNLAAQLEANGVTVKHCLPTPRNAVNLTALKTWISANYPAKDIIDTWTPLLTGTSGLKAAYDSGDGVHPNNAGHLLIGQIIMSNLPPVAGAKLHNLAVVLPPRFTSVTLLLDRNPLLTFDTVPNRTYRIDVSTDLLSWTTLTSMSSPDGKLQFIDPDATNFSQRFYRAVWVP